ncbi:PRC-barrel domain-containing protein [Shumkonia mesophila]|uniref:PRC-barrel domain-containing protein n=1 Tax=Shumkonia mesophila TaxID=2838854 RepID=UPI0029341474|nr:PRC-barrel domain-containing protein [Shumkonia mesophila]
MLKRTLLSTAAMFLIAAPALAQAPSAPAAGGDSQFTAPPSASDQKTPGSPMTMDKQQPGAAAVGASTGEVLPVETTSQIRAEALIGKKVVNASGEELGTVDDIVLSKDGMVSGLVVKTGGVMGIGGKSVAIAWQDIGSAIDADAVTLPLSKDQLEKAPEFATKEDQSQSSALPRLPDPSK